MSYVDTNESCVPDGSGNYICRNCGARWYRDALISEHAGCCVCVEGGPNESKPKGGEA